MHNLNIDLNHAAVGSLDAAMRAEFGGRISGISYNYNGSMATVHFFEEYNAADNAAALAIAVAHDPAMLVCIRDGDEVAVLVSLPRNLEAAEDITLTVDGFPLLEATALSGPNHAGGEVIVDAGPTVIGVVGDYPHDEVTI